MVSGVGGGGGVSGPIGSTPADEWKTFTTDLGALKQLLNQLKTYPNDPMVQGSCVDMINELREAVTPYIEDSLRSTTVGAVLGEALQTPFISTPGGLRSLAEIDGTTIGDLATFISNPDSTFVSILSSDIDAYIAAGPPSS